MGLSVQISYLEISEVLLTPICISDPIDDICSGCGTRDVPHAGKWVRIWFV